MLPQRRLAARRSPGYEIAHSTFDLGVPAAVVRSWDYPADLYLSPERSSRRRLCLGWPCRPVPLAWLFQPPASLPGMDLPTYTFGVVVPAPPAPCLGKPCRPVPSAWLFQPPASVPGITLPTCTFWSECSSRRRPCLGSPCRPVPFGLSVPAAGVRAWNCFLHLGEGSLRRPSLCLSRKRERERERCLNLYFSL